MHRRSDTGRFSFVKRMLVPVIVGAALAALAPAPTRADAPTPCDLRQMENQLFVLVNQARASAGLPPYTRAPELDAAARVHSLDMATTGSYSHTGTDGSQPWDRMKAAGYDWTTAGENIDALVSTAQAAMDAWMNEPADASGHRGHRENILSSDFREIGISVVYQAGSPYGYYWTQDFGARSAIPAADANYTGPTDCATVGTTPVAGPTGLEPGTLQLAAVTADGKLWHTIRYTNGNWAQFGNVKALTGDPGSITDAAVQVIGSGAGSALHLCAITSAGRLWHTARLSNGDWLPFGDVAAQASSDPGAFVSVALANINNELHVLGVTSDGKLWHTIRHVDGTWLPFGDVKGQAGDPGAFRRVAATVRPDPQSGAPSLYVLGVTAGGQLEATLRDPSGAWSPFGPTAASLSDALQCAVTFTGAGTRRDLAEVTLGGQLMIAADSSGANAAAGTIESLGSSLPQPVTRVSIAPASDSSPQVQIAAVTADGGLWHQIGSPGSWTGFGDVKGQTSDPGSVVSVSVDVLH
jgi:uncharacterized protein YkwD